METWKRALALAPALVAAAGCANLGEWTRDAVGLDQDPVRTEYDDGAPHPDTLAHAGFRSRQALICAIDAMVNQSGDRPGMCRGVGSGDASAQEVVARAEEYYHIGRLALRSQCESFLQTLASVDGQTTYGRDLANNFFDTATVAATVSQSSPIWATGLSATQNSFNSVSGSTERFLLLTESVGALRQRVVDRMEAEEGPPLNFDHYRNDPTNAAALDVARRALQAVQRYGGPCTEAGIRLIISEALATNDIGRQAQRSRYESYLDTLHRVINEGVDKGEQREFGDAEVRLAYLWAISAGAELSTDAGKVRNQIETVNLSLLAELTDDQKSRVSYYVQQAIGDRPDLGSDFESLRDELLAAYRERTEPSEEPAETPSPETPPAETPTEN